jgi:hypothetical protein
MEVVKAIDSVSSSAYPGSYEKANAEGLYDFEFFDKDGVKQWEQRGVHNTVMTAGKNLALDTYLAGSSYAVVGPFLGLISSVSYSTIAAADTMTSHAGWLEAGSGSNYPLLTARLTMNGHWSAAAAGAKALSAALSFTIGATGGTVEGAFIVFGTGAVATIGDTNGTLYSASVFSGGAQVVSAGGTLNVSYTASL